MKKLLVLSFSVFFLFASCSKDDVQEEITPNVFFDYATELSPVFYPVDGLLKITEKNTDPLFALWNYGNVNFELYNLLREYDSERDGDTIGLDNVYKALYQAGSFYEEAVAFCQTVLEVEITPPFDFGNSSTYSCAANDGANARAAAIKASGDSRNAILTWEVDDYAGSGRNEKGVSQGTFHDVTQDVTIDIVTLVQYLSVSNFAMRMELIGNALNHTFSIRLYKYNEEGYQLSIVGKGISQGEGNYFLFKVDASDPSKAESAKYFCYPANADQATLKNASDEGSDTVDPNCAAYEADVNAMTMFAEDDVPKSDADFNSGNPEVGTIYLDGVTFISDPPETE